MWSLSCRKTRRLLALSAGNDLDERDLPAAQRHLAVCPPCREVWERLRESQQVLERVNAAPAGEEGAGASLWPGVSRHVRLIDQQAGAPNWRGWLPAGALAAACLAVIIVTLPDAPFGTGTPENGPFVILPQQASFPSDPRAEDRLPVTVMPDADRDVPRVDRERPLVRPKDAGQRRSF